MLILEKLKVGMVRCLILMLLLVHVAILVKSFIIIAYTYFNDTFSLSKDGVSIPIDESGISWPGDIGGKYKRSSNSSSTQWIDP